MKIPRLLYGKYRDVSARLNKMVTALKRGAPFDEAMQAQDLVDTQELPGLIAIRGPSPLLGGGMHFHCFAPVRHIVMAMTKGRLSDSIEEPVFSKAVTQPWGVVGLLDRNMSDWVHAPERRRVFIQAVVRDWDLFVSESARFSRGDDEGRPLRMLPSNIHYALAHLGVPTEWLMGPLPPEGPALLLRRAGIEL